MEGIRNKAFVSQWGVMCVVELVAVVCGAWWHLLTAAMSGMLALIGMINQE